MDAYEFERINSQRHKDVLHILNNTFKHPTFKPHQYEIIDRILNGEDVIAIMKTGYGKSTCFQIPPIISNELAIIVSPLIALMTDQQMMLTDVGVKSCCYNSTLTAKTKKTVERDLIDGKYQILYITPESLTNAKWLIDEIYSSQGICMVAIDEAHCISSYGFDFRMSYRELHTIRTYLVNVPILAITATATEKVIDDIKTVMKMNTGTLIKTTFDRPNLCINVGVQSRDTQNKIVDLVKKSIGSIIIYCITRNDTENVAKLLTDANISAGAYHSGLTNSLRTSTQLKFMDGTYKCIVATIAFGMGINKTDIRTLIHLGCPQNIESYYQEIGRAGRDGEKSNCYLFFKERDFIIQRKFIDEIKNEEYKKTRTNLLQIMSRYVNLTSCRRKYVLSYFGENYEKDNCSSCDNCIYQTKMLVPVKKTETNPHNILINQILSTIVELRSSFGRNTIELILKGSNSKKITNEMKQCQHYGALKNMKTEQLNSLIHKLIDDRLVELHDTGCSMYVLKLTPSGHKFTNDINTQLNVFYNA